MPGHAEYADSNRGILVANEFEVRGLPAGLQPRQVVYAIKDANVNVVPLRTWACQGMATRLVGSEGPPQKQELIFATRMVRVKEASQRVRLTPKERRREQKPQVKAVTRETPARVLVKAAVVAAPQPVVMLVVLDALGAHFERGLSAMETRKSSIEQTAKQQIVTMADLEQGMNSNFERLFAKLDVVRPTKLKTGGAVDGVGT